MDCLQVAKLAGDLVAGRDLLVPLEDDRAGRRPEEDLLDERMEVVLYRFRVKIVPPAVALRVTDHMELDDVLRLDLLEPPYRIEAVVAAVDKKIGDIEEKTGARRVADLIGKFC